MHRDEMNRDEMHRDEMAAMKCPRIDMGTGGFMVEMEKET